MHGSLIVVEQPNGLLHWHTAYANVSCKSLSVSESSISQMMQMIVEFGPGAEKISQSAAQLPLAAKAMVQCADTSQERLGVVSDAACTRPSLCGDADQATMRSTRRVHEDRADHELIGTRISHERYRLCMTGLRHAALFYCLRQCHHQSSAFCGPSDFVEAVIDGSAVLNE